MQGHIHKRIRKDIRLTKPINDKSPGLPGSSFWCDFQAFLW